MTHLNSGEGDDIGGYQIIGLAAIVLPIGGGAWGYN